MARWRRMLVLLVMGGVAWVSYHYWDVRNDALPSPTRWQSVEGTVAAPEFPPSVDWFNTDRPLTMASLRGKIVLLDFWTYGCINCLHVLRDLAQLEEKFPKSLVIVGVHSPKFANEAVSGHLRQAIMRYRITHPIVNDRQMVLWRRYNVTAWPTLYLIDPDGKAITYVAGEGVYKALAELIGRVEEHFRAAGTLREGAIDWPLEKNADATPPLRYPGKVLADADLQRLFIADSGHHRVLATDLNGAMQQTFGDGTAGYVDGVATHAQFRNPQGMVRVGDTLYLADTDNHAIRTIDLRSGIVGTAAGTGSQRQRRDKIGRGSKTALNSPWDLAVMGKSLLIAMAGSHQIWKYDLDSGEVEPVIGSGQEARIDALPADAALAQPSGLATDGEQLFIADSESSAVRVAPVDAPGRVTTVAGGDLFDFGDVDGIGEQARFQHPLGVALLKDQLLIADTYNHKIKQLDLATRAVTTLTGTGRAGAHDGDLATAQFFEPGGLSVAAGQVYVADTNNHQIRVIDLANHTVRTVPITGL